MGSVFCFLLSAFCLLPTQGRLDRVEQEEKPVGLPNFFKLSNNIYSGGEPDGEKAFQSLQRLGVKTIISVDGARPDVETACKYGMRYVHFPMGYDGCPRPRALEIARAVRDLPKPVYIHCHHGKHRGPTAAAIARIVVDGISHEQAIAEMKRAGTDPRYVGLYADVRNFRKPTKAELDRASNKFPSVAPVPPFRRAMVDIDHRHTALKQSQAEGWQPPKDHPDINPPHEALQLMQAFRELNRSPEVQKRPADFRQMMIDSEQGAAQLEQALRRLATGDASAAVAADQAFTVIDRACTACHVKYRNVPRKGRG
ncbi:MAG: hypothetical protein NZT92_11320 [Abditibacteriales bacterium]|nr:hypothetical protein [Abditibacteriales bacterium]MDW8366173.1 hypothetical protein [Abditibacteriales bacterium]